MPVVIWLIATSSLICLAAVLALGYTDGGDVDPPEIGGPGSDSAPVDPDDLMPTLSTSFAPNPRPINGKDPVCH